MYKKTTKLEGGFATAKKAHEAFAQLTQTEEDKESMARRVATACDCANIVIVKVSTYQLMVSKDETVDPVVWGYMDQVCTSVTYTIDQLPTGNTVEQYQEYLDTTKATATVAYTVLDEKYAFYEDAQADLPENELSVFTDNQPSDETLYPITGDLQGYFCDLRPYALAQGEGTLKEPTQQDLSSGFLVLRWYMSGTSKLTWRICDMYMVYLKQIFTISTKIYTERYEDYCEQIFTYKENVDVLGAYCRATHLLRIDRPEIREWNEHPWQPVTASPPHVNTRIGRLFPTEAKAQEYMDEYAESVGMTKNIYGMWGDYAKYKDGGVASDVSDKACAWVDPGSYNNSRLPMTQAYHVSGLDTGALEAGLRREKCNDSDYYYHGCGVHYDYRVYEQELNHTRYAEAYDDQGNPIGGCEDWTDWCTLTKRCTNEWEDC